MVILENIDIDKAILQNIDIDEISNRFKFGISNRASQICVPDTWVRWSWIATGYLQEHNSSRIKLISMQSTILSYDLRDCDRNGESAANAFDGNCCLIVGLTIILGEFWGLVSNHWDWHMCAHSPLDCGIESGPSGDCGCPVGLQRTLEHG